MKKLFASFLFCLALTALLMVFIDPVMAATAATSAATAATAATGNSVAFWMGIAAAGVALLDKILAHTKYASNNVVEMIMNALGGIATAFNTGTSGTTSSGGGASTGGTAAS